MATATEHHHHGDGDHVHSDELPAGPLEMGAVVLNIGGDIGAAIVAMQPIHQGQELEIRPLGEEWAGMHTGIRPSGVPAIPGLFAVFGSLEEGTYEVRIKGTEAPSQTMGVVGAEVTQQSWGG